MCKALSPDLAHFRFSINSSCLLYYLGLPGGSNGKESSHNVGHLVLITELGRSPGEGDGYPLQYSCLENSMDRRYGPWGHKESNTIEQLTLSLFIVIMLIHSFLLVNISLFPGCLLSAKDYAGPEGESDESLGQ